MPRNIKVEPRLFTALSFKKSSASERPFIL